MTLEERVQQLQDRLDIRELIDKYIDAVNHRDWTRYGSLLADDFVWNIGAPFNRRILGKDAMLELVRTVQQHDYDFVFQMGHGIVIENITGDRARVRHTLHEFASHFTTVGIYYDELIRRSDGIWLFKQRDYQITYFDETRAAGDIFRRLPDPDYLELPRP